MHLMPIKVGSSGMDEEEEAGIFRRQTPRSQSIRHTVSGHDILMDEVRPSNASAAETTEHTVQSSNIPNAPSISPGGNNPRGV